MSRETKLESTFRQWPWPTVPKPGSAQQTVVWNVTANSLELKCILHYRRKASVCVCIASLMKKLERNNNNRNRKSNVLLLSTVLTVLLQNPCEFGWEVCWTTKYINLLIMRPFIFCTVGWAYRRLQAFRVEFPLSSYCSRRSLGHSSSGNALSCKLEVGWRRSLASHCTSTTAYLRHTHLSISDLTCKHFPV